MSSEETNESEKSSTRPSKKVMKANFVAYLVFVVVSMDDGNSDDGDSNDGDSYGSSCDSNDGDSYDGDSNDGAIMVVIMLAMEVAIVVIMVTMIVM